MCHSATVFITLLILTKSNAQSTDEQQGYRYSNVYAPSTVNFNDIYTNNLGLLSDEPSTAKDEEFHINNIPSQFVEFHQQPQTISPVTPPPPVYILHSSQFNQNVTTSSTTSTTTEETEESSVKVLPIKNDFQRGVLDLLFPAARVRTFKSVFDSIRRILSHTFKK